jgi:hypothetical protein
MLPTWEDQDFVQVNGVDLVSVIEQSGAKLLRVATIMLSQ